jgi:small subunit ribosomal protein S13
LDKEDIYMPRVAGIDIPVNKQAWVSLQYIYGIGPSLSHKILDKAKIAPDVKVKDLTEEEVNKLREIIDKQYRVEGELRKEINYNIKRLVEIGSYRGIRHRHGLPVWGQRTRTNARTKRGSRKTVAGRGQKRGATKK